MLTLFLYYLKGRILKYFPSLQIGSRKPRVEIMLIMHRQFLSRVIACLCMQSVILLWLICPSVCPSHCGIISKRMHNIVKLYPHLVEACLQFSECYRRYIIPSETPSKGALNTHGVIKFAIFDSNRRLSRKQYEISPCLLRITNRKSQVADRSVSVPMTLSGLENVTRGVNFSGRYQLM